MKQTITRMNNREKGCIGSRPPVASDQFVQEEDYWLNKFSGFSGKRVIPYKPESDDKKKPVRDSIAFGFPDAFSARIMKITGGSDVKLNIILAAGLMVWLARYTDNRDITLGSPIYKQELDTDFINTVLPLRVQIKDDITFKEMVINVGKVIFEAIKNQNYPLETLLYKLGIPFSAADVFPLFDTAILLENIHDKKYIQHITLDMIFSFIRVGDQIQGKLEYRSLVIERSTASRLISLFMHIFQEAVLNENMKVTDLEFLEEEGRYRILYEFNDTQKDYPANKCLHWLFYDQAACTPDRTALKGCLTENEGYITLTYKTLKKTSEDWAMVLTQKGVTPGEIVVIMMERSFELIIGIWAILTAGGGYLPIDPRYPRARTRYMIDDCASRWVLTRKNILEQLELGSTCEFIDMDAILILNQDSEVSRQPYDNISRPVDPAYVIYTSGSTGNPKGVVIEHHSVINRLAWMQRIYPITWRDVLIQKTPVVFDVSVWELFWWSIQGASLLLLAPGGEKNPLAILEAIEQNHVTTIHFVPSMLNVFLEYLESTGTANRLSPLTRVFCSGEALLERHVKYFNRLLSRFLHRGLKLVNLYGPTEATVDVSYFNCPTGSVIETIPIGKPIDNIHLYILSKDLKLQPVEVPGELCIAGVGLARGYLNRPELTAEKFDHDLCDLQDYQDKKNKSFCGRCPDASRGQFFQKAPPLAAGGKKIYKTGDRALWMPDGNILFIGRIDHQVKIRGFRIELGEIENRLLQHDAVKEVVVVVGEGADQDNYLCAYLVPEKELTVSIPSLKAFLSESLPVYMIPTYFVELEKIPLTTNGKIDRKALPSPKIESGAAYIAPRDRVEEQFVRLWSQVLGVKQEEIGIDSNFFEIGGHSLKATILISRIHKEFNIQLPLLELFKKPTIRKLSKFVKIAEKEKHTSIDCVEKKEYYDLSSTQKRLFIMNQMTPHSIDYNLPQAIQLEGDLDKQRMESAFKQLIQRHESLRTAIDFIKGEHVQVIHPPAKVAFEVEYIESDDKEVRQLASEFVKSFNWAQAPLLRVKLIKVTASRHILFIDMHHIITDGMSQEIFIKECIALYQGDELPVLKLQYKDYSEWQTLLIRKGALKRQEEYWLDKFNGSIPVLNLPQDLSGSTASPFEGKRFTFGIDQTLTRRTKELTTASRSTLYMVLLAVYNVMLSKYTDQDDIVVGTPIAGRKHADLQNIIGLFVNMLAMRNHPHRNKTFKEFLAEVAANCLDGYENQDYQFEELVRKLNKNIGRDHRSLIDTVFVLQNYSMPANDKLTVKLAEHNLKTHTPSTPKRKISRHYFLLMAVETKNGINITFIYNTRLYKEKTIEKMGRHFVNILERVLEEPEIKLGDINILDQEDTAALIQEVKKTDSQLPGGDEKEIGNPGGKIMADFNF